MAVVHSSCEGGGIATLSCWRLVAAIWWGGRRPARDPAAATSADCRLINSIEPHPGGCLARAARWLEGSWAGLLLLAGRQLGWAAAAGWLAGAQPPQLRLFSAMRSRISCENNTPVFMSCTGPP